MRQSNFDFLKGTPYEPTFPYLREFEQQFLLNPEQAGNLLRSFWEIFSTIAIESTGLQNEYQEYLNSPFANGAPKTNKAGVRMSFLQNQPKFASKTIRITEYFTYYDRAGNEYTERRYLPDYTPKPNRDYQLLFYFRTYAHAFHHTEEENTNAPRYNVSFHHTQDYVTMLQSYLLDFLGLSVEEKIDFRKMPLCVNNAQTVFYMESELITAMDPSLLQCRYSFSGTMYPNKDNDEAYFAIIQLFDKNDPALPLEQLERCATTYAATRRSKFGEALRDIRVLSGYHGYAEFYILAYIFEEPAQPLTEQLLQSISKADRLILCREIARILYKLHTAKPAIYHRFLNHNCIYLCNNIESDILWYPSITGFSLAKINRDNQPTVLVKDSKDRISRHIPVPLRPYIPLGWADSVNDCGDAVDIYSMGILFFHILTGKFNHNITVNAKNPIKKYFSTIRSTLLNMPPEVATLITDMLNPLGAMRPSAKEVFERLDKLCK